jgi:hypothetical protein
MDPIITTFVALFSFVVSTSNPTAPLPSCEQMKQESPAAYRLQTASWSHDGFVNARPLKTCKD